MGHQSNAGSLPVRQLRLRHCLRPFPTHLTQRYYAAAMMTPRHNTRSVAILGLTYRRYITVPTVIAGQVKHIRTAVEQPPSQRIRWRHTAMCHPMHGHVWFFCGCFSVMVVLLRVARWPCDPYKTPPYSRHKRDCAHTQCMGEVDGVPIPCPCARRLVGVCHA